MKLLTLAALSAVCTFAQATGTIHGTVFDSSGAVVPGPEPPPIDHHGIDDAFLGKASVTWYCHQGRWRQLQGAD